MERGRIACAKHGTPMLWIDQRMFCSQCQRDRDANESKQGISILDKLKGGE